MLLFTYLFVLSATFVCYNIRVSAIDYDCVSSCSSYTCVTNKTICRMNTYLSQCGCCHLCVKGNLEFCGGLFGRYGVCGKGLGCTVNEKTALRGESRGVGICRPMQCLRRCKRKRISAVCGSDGLVYKNSCEMKRYACLKGLHISQQPLSHCVNTRRCHGYKFPCDFVMLFNKNGNVNRSWRQAYKCRGMHTCSDEFRDTAWCASNGRSYSSKCEINVHSCITHDQLTAAYQGACSASDGEVGHVLLPLDTHTQPIVTDVPDSGAIPVYNSSDPYST